MLIKIVLYFYMQNKKKKFDNEKFDFNKDDDPKKCYKN